MSEKSYYDTHNATLNTKTGEWDHYEIDERGRRLPLSKLNQFLDSIRALFGKA
jgi:hypothetical protein